MGKTMCLVSGPQVDLLHTKDSMNQIGDNVRGRRGRPSRKAPLARASFCVLLPPPASAFARTCGRVLLSGRRGDARAGVV